MVTADKVRQAKAARPGFRRKYAKNAIISRNKYLTYRSVSPSEGCLDYEKIINDERLEFAFLYENGWIAYLKKYANLTEGEEKRMKNGESFAEVRPEM